MVRRTETDPSSLLLFPMQLSHCCQSSREHCIHYRSLSMHSCKSLLACDNVFFSPILSLKLTLTTPVALLQSWALTPFIDSSSIDDKSCLLVLTRIVQYRYSGNGPARSESPHLHPRNSTNLSIRSSRTIVSFLSRRLVIHFTHPHRTHPATLTSPRRITQEGSGTIQQHASVIQPSSLRLSSRNSVYDASSLFFGLWSSSLSMLRLRVCLNMCHHFDALPGAFSHLSLLPTRRATIKHTRLLRIARPIKITCCTSGNWTDTGNAHG